jgi:hypothetical protein
MSLVDMIGRFHEDDDESSGYVPAVKSVRQWLNAQPPQAGITDVIRASGISFLCPREFVLNYWNPRPYKSFEWSAQFKMSIGTHLHEYLQNVILGPMGVLHGSWVREHEGSVEVREGFHPDPEKAIWSMQRQLPMEWVFREESLWDPKHRIRGHIDGRISKLRMEFLSKSGRLLKESLFEAMRRCNDIEDDELPLYEIKSTGTYAFNGITSVDKIPEYYKMQASVYQWLAGSSETVFLYMERDGIKMRGFSYIGEQGRVDDAKRKSRKIWEAIRDERLPEGNDVPSKDSPFRKEIVLRDGSDEWKEWLEVAKKKGASEGS